LGGLTKTIFRREILSQKRRVCAHEYEKRNRLFAENARTLLDRLDASVLHVYLPIVRNREPDTFPLLQHYYRQGATVVVTRTLFDKAEMLHFQYNDQLVLENNSFGIPEPVTGEPANLDLVTAVLVPLLAADKMGNRVGYGKGYYDRMLHLLPAGARRIGCSLSPLFDCFPFVEPHDFRMDFCITPFEITECL